MKDKDDPIKAYARRFHGQTRIIERPTKQIPHSPATLAYRRRKGYVYYMGDGNGRIKIGFSKNPWSRLDEARRFNPSVEILAVEKDDGDAGGMLCLERQRHEQFKELHLALEWFKAENKLLDWIEILKAPHEIMKSGSDFDAKETDK